MAADGRAHPEPAGAGSAVTSPPPVIESPASRPPWPDGTAVPGAGKSAHESDESAVPPALGELRDLPRLSLPNANKNMTRGVKNI